VFEFDHAIHGWVSLRRSFRMFPLNARTGERNGLSPPNSGDCASLDVERPLSGSRHSSPRLPNHPRCRDTTSCVGVGRVDT
jgi:hypothetical protein